MSLRIIGLFWAIKAAKKKGKTPFVHFVRLA
jgi:hypothetical protein